jgi:cell division transport system ATP-binding protein
MEEEKNIIVKFENVSKVYKGDFMALENVSLEITTGEFVSIIGPSGAGKSTLLKMIYAEESPSVGAVYFNGISLGGLSRRKLPFHRRMIGTVFQDFSLLPNKTAYENIAYALEVLGVSSTEIAEDVPQILDIVGMTEKMNKYPDQLSGGEKQKIAIARALIHKPLIIVADEPTVNLDPVSSLEIVELLMKINSFGTTIILATHQKEVVNKVQKRVIVIDNGVITGDSPNGKYKLN